VKDYTRAQPKLIPATVLQRRNGRDEYVWALDTMQCLCGYNIIERERVCVCVCERERESVCVCVREREHVENEPQEEGGTVYRGG